MLTFSAESKHEILTFSSESCNIDVNTTILSVVLSTMSKDQCVLGGRLKSENPVLCPFKPAKKFEVLGPGGAQDTPSDRYFTEVLRDGIERSQNSRDTTE